jgi:hypothetical protein
MTSIIRVYTFLIGVFLADLVGKPDSTARLELDNDLASVRYYTHSFSQLKVKDYKLKQPKRYQRDGVGQQCPNAM